MQIELDFWQASFGRGGAVEIDADLVPFLSEETGRRFGLRNVVIDVGGAPLSADQLRRAVSADLGIELHAHSTISAFSLKYLEPVIGSVRQLFISLAGTVVTDARILEDAANLQNLVWQYPSLDEVVDLSRLLRLARFVGALPSQLESMLDNACLDELNLYSEAPSTLPTIGAPLKSLLIGDRRATDRLPELEHPGLLRSFRVDMPRRFDAASLLAAPNLEKVQLLECGRLENLEALTKLSNLSKLEVYGSSQEDWDVLLGSSSASATFILSPDPSKKLRDEGARRGWVVAGKHDQRSGRLMPFDLLDPWEEGGGPVLHLDDFAAVAEMIAATVGAEALDEEGVNGHLVEDLLRAACEADPELSGAVIEFDSEAGGMYAAFPTRKLAQRAVRATLALLRDPDKLRAVLARVNRPGFDGGSSSSRGRQ